MNEVFEKKAVTSSEFPVILFDAGGTLVHFQPKLSKFYLEQLKANGIQKSESEIESALDRCISFFNEQSEADSNFQLPSKIWIERFVSELGETNSKLVPSIQSAFRTYVKLAISRTVIEVLSALQLRGYRMGIVSNFEEEITQWLRLQGVLDLFDVVITASDVNAYKPAKEIFSAAIEDLDIEASQCAFVGNSFAADVLGAKRMSMLPILYDPDHREIRSLSTEDTSQKVVSMEALRHNRRLQGVKIIFRFEDLLQFFV